MHFMTAATFPGESTLADTFALQRGGFDLSRVQDDDRWTVATRYVEAHDNGYLTEVHSSSWEWRTKLRYNDQQKHRGNAKCSRTLRLHDRASLVTYSLSRHATAAKRRLRPTAICWV